MSAEKLITEHIDLWTSSIKAKKTQGRGSSKKYEFYGLKKLRELILELAVRGKLVPQDSSEESAKDLLKRIASESELLVKDKKNSKKKQLLEFNTEWSSFELPNGWTAAYIPQVVAIDKYSIKRGPFGSSLKKAYFVASGYKVYEQQHAINNDFYRGEYYIDQEKYEELSAFAVLPNDLIISCSGTVGKVAVAPSDMEPGIINQALLKITLNESGLINNYFKILFPAFYMNTDTLSDLKGTAQKNMVSVATLKKEPFPLPPLTEQHRIVSKVDELMALCDQLEQQTETSLEAHKLLVDTLLTTLTDAHDANELSDNWARLADHFDTLITTDYAVEQLKQTILQLAVQGKLVPQDPNDEPASELLKRIAAEKEKLLKDKKIKKQKGLKSITKEEQPFNLPGIWLWARLSDVALVIDPNPSHRMPNYVECGIPFISTENFTDKGIDFTIGKKVEKSVLDKQIEKFELREGAFAMSRIGTIGKTMFLPIERNYCMSHALCVISPYLPIFSYDYLKFVVSAESSLSQAHEGVQSVGVPDLGMGVIRSLLIPVPPINEQDRIVEKVEELLELCARLKSELYAAGDTQLYLTNVIAKRELT